MRHLLLFASAFALAYLCTWVVRFAGVRLGLVDIPRSDRWNRRPVPRLGGIAIYLSFTLTLLIFGGGPASELLPLLLGGAAIFLVGLVDDFIHLENRSKLILLILCAVLATVLGIRFEMFPSTIGVPLAILWILGVTNAFNWLDNMDGVAGGVATISAVNLFVFSLISGRGDTSHLAIMLAGATAGFLLHNFPPARIFMGDSGSGFVGFTLATIAVMSSYQSVSNVLVSVLVPGLILALPIFDTALVTVQRLFNHRPIFQGGRDHPAHRLVALGLPERKAVFTLYGLGTLAGATALVTSSLDFLAGMSVSIILILVFVALGLVLSEVHIYEGTLPSNGVTPLPRPFWNKRWIFLIFVDIALVSVAYVGAHLLRYDGALPVRTVENIVSTLPIIVAGKMVGLYLAGVYRGKWRYASVLDFLRLAEGVTAGSLIGIGVLLLWGRLEGISRAALILDWMVTLLLVAASRFSLSLVRDYLVAHAEAGRRVIIFGAGSRGALLVRVLRENPSLGYRPVGFVDDDPAERGTIIQGLSILGGRHDLQKLIRQHHVDEVLLALPSYPPDLVEEIRTRCDGSGVAVKRLELTLE